MKIKLATIFIAGVLAGCVTPGERPSSASRVVYDTIKISVPADLSEYDQNEERIAADQRKLDAQRAEADRIAAERRALEQEQQQEAERLEAERVAAEQRRIEAQQAEANRLADEQRAEADRIAAERRALEQEQANQGCLTGCEENDEPADLIVLADDSTTEPVESNAEKRKRLRAERAAERKRIREERLAEKKRKEEARLAAREQKKLKAKQEKEALALASPEPPAVEKRSKKRTIADYKDRVSVGTLIRAYFKEYNYDILEIDFGTHEPVFRDQAPNNLQNVLNLLNISKSNIISDRATDTVVIKWPGNEGSIHIGDAFVTSDYGTPLQMLMPIKHDPSLSVKGEFSSPSHYINTLNAQEVKTSYGTLLRIYTDEPINNSFILIADFYDDNNRSTMSRKEVFVEPKRPEGSVSFR